MKKTLLMLFIIFYFGCINHWHVVTESHIRTGQEPYKTICLHVDKNRLTNISTGDRPSGLIRAVTLEELAKDTGLPQVARKIEECDKVIMAINKLIPLLDRLVKPYLYTSALANELKTAQDGCEQWKYQNSIDLLSIEQILKELLIEVPDINYCRISWHGGIAIIYRTNDNHLFLTFPLTTSASFNVPSIEKGLMVAWCSDNVLEIEVDNGVRNNMASYLQIGFDREGINYKRKYKNAKNRNWEAVIIDIQLR